ncbi:MAG: serine/threonine protein kinase, partial [Planctomycetes bacterium]|nr:serine/threonine protein kinase [Planctomycetota bacterium]
MPSDPPTLGQAALRRGLLTAAQLDEALTEQARRAGASGTPPELGELLVELGLLAPRQLATLRPAPEPTPPAPTAPAAAPAAPDPAPSATLAPPAPPAAATLLGTPTAVAEPASSADAVTLRADLRPAAAPARGPGFAEPPEVAAAARRPECRLGKYLLVQELGRGGMGVVYRAWESGLRRWVAVKTITPGAAGDAADAPPGGAESSEAERFLREARLAARLRHPGIVAVHEVGAEAGRRFLVMDLVRGCSLRALMNAARGAPPASGAAGPVAAGGGADASAPTAATFRPALAARPAPPGVTRRRLPADLATLLPLLRDVARALEYAHAEAVVHRDLKPENVLIDVVGDDAPEPLPSAARQAPSAPSPSPAPAPAAAGGGRGEGMRPSPTPPAPALSPFPAAPLPRRAQREGGAGEGRGGGVSAPPCAPAPSPAPPTPADAWRAAGRGRVRALLADFGLARDLSSGSNLTISGQVLGTPAYMSPEQARGRVSAVDARSDLFSFGAMLYDVATGRRPFEADDVLELLRRVAEEDPPPPRRHRPEIDRDLETVILRCLEKDPARRYPSAGAVADDLDRYLADEPIAARPVGFVGRLARRVARAPRVAAAALILVLALGGALAALARAQSSGAQRLYESRLADSHARAERAAGARSRGHPAEAAAAAREALSA